jgi:carbon monoxide dehydrogenase subunit G
MPRFEGDREFSLSQEESWAKLTDARFLVQCIPDVESVTEQEADQAQLVLRPGFSFVRGTLEVSLRVVDAVHPSSARVLLQSKGIGNSSDVEAALQVTPREGGSRVHWAAEIKSLGGLLKMVPSGLIQGAAQKVIADVWSRVEASLSAEAHG